MSAGKPWAVSTSWKDFCKSLQCHSSFDIYIHCPQPTNGTPLVTRVVNAAGRSNFARTGRERGMLLRARYCPQFPTSATSMSTKRLGYVSRPAFGAVSPCLISFPALSCGYFPWYVTFFFFTHPLGFHWVLNQSRTVDSPLSSPREYENGYPVFNSNNGEKGGWCLAADFAA